MTGVFLKKGVMLPSTLFSFLVKVFLMFIVIDCIKLFVAISGSITLLVSKLFVFFNSDLISSENSLRLALSFAGSFLSLFRPFNS
jgi:hypothetical protein